MCNPAPTYRYSITLLFVFTTWVGVLLAFTTTYGVRGFALGAGTIACSWFLIARSKYESLRPLSNNKFPVTDLLVLLSICAVLYGLGIPAVEMRGRRRTPPPGTVGKPTVKIAGEPLTIFCETSPTEASMPQLIRMYQNVLDLE